MLLHDLLLEGENWEKKKKKQQKKQTQKIIPLMYFCYIKIPTHWQEAVGPFIYPLFIPFSGQDDL